MSYKKAFARFLLVRLAAPLNMAVVKSTYTVSVLSPVLMPDSQRTVLFL